MKTLKAQRGFFDFGIGLGLLAIFGGTAAVVTTDKEEQTIVVEQQVQSQGAQEELPTELTVVQSVGDE